MTSRRRWIGRALGVLTALDLTWVCCGVDYPKLVEGEADYALYGKGKPWDHAPGLLLLRRGRRERRHLRRRSVQPPARDPVRPGRGGRPTDVRPGAGADPRAPGPVTDAQPALAPGEPDPDAEPAFGLEVDGEVFEVVCSSSRRGTHLPLDERTEPRAGVRLQPPEAGDPRRPPGSHPQLPGTDRPRDGLHRAGLSQRAQRSATCVPQTLPQRSASRRTRTSCGRLAAIDQTGVHSPPVISVIRAWPACEVRRR